MQNLPSLRVLKRLCLQSLKSNCKQQNSAATYYTCRESQQNAGFSLVEVVVVVLMIGILAAISLPSWLAFVNRQRLNKANDAVLAAIQQAQTEAKKKKLSYIVSFQKTATVEYAVYPKDGTPKWKPLGEDLGIDAKQLELGANLSGENTGGASVSSLSAPSAPAKITFDYLGTLPNASFDPDVGLKIVLAAPGGSVLSSSQGLKRCVIVTSLLGTTLTKKDSDCK